MPEKSKKPEYIYFKLGKKTSKFVTPDNNIDLSIFVGRVHGKVKTNDPVNFPIIIRALQVGELTRTDKEEKDSNKREKMVDLTNVRDEKVKHSTMARSYLMKLKKPELVAQIPKIQNPYLVATMIEHESRGKNVSKRRREDVISLLKARLDELTKDIKTEAVMFQYLEDTKEGAKVTRDPDSSENDEAEASTRTDY